MLNAKGMVSAASNAKLAAGATTLRRHAARSSKRIACHGALIDLLTNDDIAFSHSTGNFDSLFAGDAKDDRLTTFAVAVTNHHEVAFAEGADGLRRQPQGVFALFDDDAALVFEAI